MGRAVNKKCCAMLRAVYKVTAVKTACRHTGFLATGTTSQRQRSAEHAAKDIIGLRQDTRL